MKRFLKKLLWLPVLIGCIGALTPTGVARLASVAQLNQGTLCPPNLDIESVTYLGRNNGKDSVQVVFNAQATRIGQGLGITTTCASYGVPPVQAGGLQSQQGFGGAAVVGQVFGYELTVTIRRKLGNQDTAKTESNNIFNGRITAVVQIPRAALETDPVAYDVTIKTTFGGQTRRTLTAQGNGAPALAAATQAFANSSVVPLLDSCFPSVSISGLSFTPGSGSTPDAVTIDWTASRSPSDCLPGPRVLISVEVKRPDNSIGRAAAHASANSTTVTLSGAPAAPVSFIVRVSAETRLGQTFEVTRKGEFSNSKKGSFPCERLYG